MTSGGTSVSTESPSQQLQAAVEQTLASHSFLVHTAAQTLDYQAPNRTEVVHSSGNPEDLFTMVTVGSETYVRVGPDGGWIPQPSGLSQNFGGVTQAREYLQALSVFRHATVNGDVFTVHSTLSKLPCVLAVLTLTSTVRTSSGEVIQTYGGVPNADRVNVTGQIVVQDGRVTSETFEARGRLAQAGEPVHHFARGTVSYSAFDSSPSVPVPTARQVISYPASCNTTATTQPTGSCTVTIRGIAPHSALCRATHTGPTHAQAIRLLAQLEASEKSGNWSAVKPPEAAFLADLHRTALAVLSKAKGTPGVDSTARVEDRYIAEMKNELERATSTAQFEKATSTLFFHVIETNADLEQYVAQQCGGTETIGGVSAVVATPTNS